ncbi:bifunctional glutamate N-acetyltransferase/amino-acid acetyltransferase ArgJ [Pseudemcibacter aquimaris]|uniref:bifunctional glutamate N-acetyltransferase/amino-acid acetyltransferase ArgJ n=1 Tax=Pseudemcibacter aquimaris TaxID=2857064 RepID=UPI0020113C7B|nr:bifunctional glutamate N-acetyltransferase/amino-acid acetyltransferase ArgJ [Pseudemcibacter aquimaris]MCC3861809.1 bifunctional glutamate N-acetyltransferase/amino-acid acetyltransferase ArgJ [Pseudemcibacter aquimaris]WDU58564.1 bifunctional glutamate N-acetyltransferase/amino-acid acetyltransferase ArgJ [Pseudemcibacter aquimaris]
MTKKSPLAPKENPSLPALDGVLLSTAATEMKYKGRDDLLLVSMPNGAAVAGVFTTSKCYSAPVGWCRDILKSGKQAKAVLVNAGNSNAFTGKSGDAAMKSNVEKAAKTLGCDPEEVYVASTGVIGEVLDAKLINDHIDGAVNKLGPDHWQQAAGAILTTDTFEKVATRTAMIDGKQVTINGIAKGSGMIAPDMATMLGFAFTDAAIDQDVLQALLTDTSNTSFNSITVDSDTSTSDTVLLFATGKENSISDINDPRLDDFKEKLSDLMLDLSHQIVRDGEGASKFVSISVSGAEHDGAAKNIAMSIANSPLVKTAIAGEDANWGRIVMAVGKAGEMADRDKLDIHIGGQKVTENGMAVPGYDEDKCTEHLKGEEIDINVDVGIADGKATVWTCDLTHEYITINADYRS